MGVSGVNYIMSAEMESALEQLPRSVLQSILSRLDAGSICTAASCSRLLRTCAEEVLTQLEVVTLVDMRAESSVVERVLTGNTVLKSLTLDCTKMDDKVVNTLTRPQLHTLCLVGCDQFSANLLLEIAKWCPLLKVLSLELGLEEDDRQEIYRFSTALEKVLQGCRHLESLTLHSEASCFDTGAYAAIPRLLTPGLKVLEIGFIAERDVKLIFDVSDEHRVVAPTSHPFSGLERLSLVLDRITDPLLSLIALRLPHLLELELRDGPSENPLQAFDLTNWGIQQVGKCTKLRRLCLVRSQYWHSAVSFKRVTDLGILIMAESCSNLESIRFGGFSRITDAGCRAVLHSCLKLHTFELSNTRQITDLSFHDLSATPLGLECVSLASCGLISDCSIKHLAFCTNLKSLNLKGCKSVGDDSMKSLATLSKLKVLALNGTDTSDQGLAVLGTGIAALSCLSLRGCHRLTDDGIASLLVGALAGTLESLDLSGNSELTDATTLSIVRGKLHLLQELRLRECPRIGDTSVISLASAFLKDSNIGFGGALRLLDLWNCNSVTAVSVVWLKKPFFAKLRWLGLGWTLKHELVEDLAKSRPSLHLCSDGSELGHMFSGEFEEAQLHHPYEGEDELERWMRGDNP